MKTGRLSSFPLGGEDNLYLQLDYRPDSKLVIAHWESKGRCIRQSYVWTGKDFRQIDVAEIGDERACAGRARS